MWMLLPLMLVPLVVMGFMWVSNRGTFTLKEFLLLEGIMLVLLLGGFQYARYAAIADTEVWNGYLTSKDEGTQSCCHCRSVCDSRDKDGNCTRSHEECDHIRDYWWSLSVSTGDKIREGCSGSSRDPGWWTGAIVGEPASVPHTYTNYLLADPNSVLLQQNADSAQRGEVPSYPHVYDKYKVTRFLPGGTSAPTHQWDSTLDVINSDLGKPKQVNIVVVATRDPSPTFADRVEAEWLFGKKNDVIFVLGAPDGDTIDWARVVTISKVEMLKLTARDELPGMRLSDVEGTSGHLRKLVETRFTRTPMAEFDYLWSAASPGTFGTLLLYLLAFAGSFGGSLVMISKDVFGDERRRW